MIIAEAFDITKRSDLIYDESFRQDRVIRQIDEDTQVSLAFRKILDRGIPRFMADISVSYRISVTSLLHRLSHSFVA